MKRKIILVLIIASLIAIVSSFLLNHSNKTDKKIENYMLYMANTNFPVVFADGDWSKELKEFVMTDLNCIYNNVEFSDIGLNESVEMTVQRFFL